MASIIVSGDTSGAVTITAPAIAGTTTLTLPTTSGTIVTTGGAASLTTSGNLTFTGTGNRITGDFSNATASSQVAFQSSTTNGQTNVYIAPNGTSTTAAIRVTNDSSLANFSSLGMAVTNTTALIQAAQFGSGSFLPLAIQTGGSERLRIDTSGNVGIGTSSPVGSLQLLRTSDPQFIITDDQNSSFSFGTTTGYSAVGTDAAAITFKTGVSTGSLFATGTERMRIDSSGNIGIGISSPAKRLAVQNATDSTTVGTNAVMTVQAGSSVNSVAEIGFGYNNWSGTNPLCTIGYQITSNAGVGLGAITFATRNVTTDTAPTERMRIDSSGNVLVGTTALATGFSGFAQIEASGSSGGIVIDSTAGNICRLMFTKGNATGNEGLIRYDTSNYSMQFWTDALERMRITSGGNLLLGRTSGVTGIAPDGAFNVYSNSTSGSYSFADFSTSGASVFRIKNDGYLIAATTYNNTSGSAANMYIDAGGYIYRSTSSQKYKTNIENATYGLLEVLQLRPVTYQSNQKDGNGNLSSQVFGGLIAEEVDAIGLKEFVQYAEDGSPDALAYGNMVSLLAKAIQEQQAMIEELKARIETLEAK